MPLNTIRKMFLVTDDTTNLLANDNELGGRGKGRYRIFAAADVVDATLTVRDASAVILNAVAIPPKAAGVTYPTFERDKDLFWEVTYDGNGDTLPVDIADGTTGNVFVVVEYLGR